MTVLNTGLPAVGPLTCHLKRDSGRRGTVREERVSCAGISRLADASTTRAWGQVERSQAVNGEYPGCRGVELADARDVLEREGGAFRGTVEARRAVDNDEDVGCGRTRLR